MKTIKFILHTMNYVVWLSFLFLVPFFFKNWWLIVVALPISILGLASFEEKIEDL